MLEKVGTGMEVPMWLYKEGSRRLGERQSAKIDANQHVLRLTTSGAETHPAAPQERVKRKTLTVRSFRNFSMTADLCF